MKVVDPLAGYEMISKDAAAYTKVLVNIWDRFGQPTDCESEVGWKMLDNIIKVWIRAYPYELQEFIQTNKDALDAERSVRESVRAGGIMSLAYPERLFQMIKLFMPQVKLNDKKFYTKLIRRYPIFRTSNYA